MGQETDIVEQLINGFRGTTLIVAAVRTGLFDNLTDVPRTPRELAAELQLHEPTLARVLRGLALLGLVAEEVHAKENVVGYYLTTTGEKLRSDVANTLNGYARLCSQQYLPAWMQIEASLKEGEQPFRKAYGVPVWEYRHIHAEEGWLFDTWLQGQTSAFVAPIVEACDFHDGQRIADVGGGTGVLLAGVLRKHLNMVGVLAEQPSVIERARKWFQLQNLQDRCEFVPTDFFVSVRHGCDTYLLKSVLHDWEDEDCVKILNTIRQSMSSSSRLLLIERLLPLRAADAPDTIWLDLHMLCITGGRERSAEEYERLLGRANLRLHRVMKPDSPFSILEIVKA
jgi:DNA-binding MarR family transcriptional regulator